MLSHDATRILSVAILIGAAGIPVLAFWRARRRSPMRLPQYILYAINILITRIYWRASVEGDLDGVAGAVICYNHRSSVDPNFLYLVTNRIVHWMVAREYCHRASLKWFLKTAEIIPVGRGGIDTAATKAAIRLAQAGELVGMFPEGRINKSDDLMLPGRPGAALVALRAGVPIVPCYLRGSPTHDSIVGTVLQPARAHLIVGKPIDLSAESNKSGEREVLERVTRRVIREIAALGGVKDFTPRLAGRQWKPRE